MPTSDQLNLLLQARDKAATLLISLQQDQAELSQTWVGIPPQTVHQGQVMYDNAVDAVQLISDNFKRATGK